MRSLILQLAMAASALVGIPAAAADDTVDALLKEAAQALSRGQAEEALALANKAVARDPQHAAPFILRAAIHEAQDRHADAAADYTRAIALDPRAAEVYNRRGSAYFKL